MATMRHLSTQSEKNISRRTTVGRDPTCELTLNSPSVSKQHATIRWTGAQWIIKDLGSRNGTTVNEKLLLSTSFPLSLGDEIGFGDPKERWSWIDGAAPPVGATDVSGNTLEAKGGMLLLPDESAPLAAVFLRGEHWQLEIGGDVRTVRDGEWVDVEGARYCLQLPALDATADRTQTIVPRRSILDATISFLVSLDEEHVRLWLETEGRTFELAPRAFGYMLVLLARQRQADMEAGVALAEAGWLYADDFAAKLGAEPTALATNVFRARRAVDFDENGEPRRQQGAEGAKSWFEDSYEIVQRRAGQIRLGLSKIVFTTEDRSSPVPRRR